MGDLTVKCVAGSGTFKSTANAESDLGGFVLGWHWSSSEKIREGAKSNKSPNSR
jgi:hypothetical protein